LQLAGVLLFKPFPNEASVGMRDKGPNGGRKRGAAGEAERRTEKISER
jgi:hypothetical protein